MRSVEKVGRTREEAVRSALKELGVGLDEAKVETLTDRANPDFSACSRANRFMCA